MAFLFHYKASCFILYLSGSSDFCFDFFITTVLKWLADFYKKRIEKLVDIMLRERLSVSKKMIVTFVPKATHVATVPLRNRITVTAHCYTTICVPEVAELRNTNLQRRIIIHQDNSSSHTTLKIIEFLKQQIELLNHPPYSPERIA